MQELLLIMSNHSCEIQQRNLLESWKFPYNYSRNIHIFYKKCRKIHEKIYKFPYSRNRYFLKTIVKCMKKLKKNKLKYFITWHRVPENWSNYTQIHYKWLTFAWKHLQVMQRFKKLTYIEQKNYNNTYKTSKNRTLTQTHKLNKKHACNINMIRDTSVWDTLMGCKSFLMFLMIRNSLSSWLRFVSHF